MRLAAAFLALSACATVQPAPVVTEPPLSAKSVAIDPLMLSAEQVSVKRAKCLARCPEARADVCNDACRVTYSDAPRQDLIRAMGQ